jgi:hypothetical protein
MERAAERARLDVAAWARPILLQAARATTNDNGREGGRKKTGS